MLEAGLGFAVAIDKPDGPFGPFIGKPAVAERRAQGLARRLLAFRLDDPEPLVFHGEPIWRDGRLVGHVTSGAYGHSLGASVALGYAEVARGEPVAETLAARWEIEIAGTRHPASASLKPLYDPTGARMRG